VSLVSEQVFGPAVPRLTPRTRTQAFYAAVQQAGGDDAASIASDGSSVAPSSVAASSHARPWALQQDSASILEDAPFDAPLPQQQPGASFMYGNPGGSGQGARMTVAAPAAPYAVPVGHYEPSVVGSDAASYAPAPSYAPSLLQGGRGGGYAASFAASEVRALGVSWLCSPTMCWITVQSPRAHPVRAAHTHTP